MVLVAGACGSDGRVFASRFDRDLYYQEASYSNAHIHNMTYVQHNILIIYIIISMFVLPEAEYANAHIVRLCMYDFAPKSSRSMQAKTERELHELCSHSHRLLQ